MVRCFAAALAVIFLAAGAHAQASAPAPPRAQIETPKERAPIDIRRTTIIVSDIDRSLALYRDALGLFVNYDERMNVSSYAFTQGTLKPRPIRLVLLNANDPYIGWIGLLQYTDGKKTPAMKKKHLGIGSHVIVTAVADAAKACAAAEKVPGVRMVNPLKDTTYPGRNGGPAFKVRGCQFFDADGAYLELNQSLS